MINLTFFFGAISLMLIIISRDLIIKFFGVDIQKMQIEDLFRDKTSVAIEKHTGSKSLVMVNPGNNRATVMATLRQITGIDKTRAKKIVNNKVPYKFMTGISEKEAFLTRRALEFVGAEIEIK